MTKWRVKDRTMDPISHKLHHGGIAISDWFSDKLKNITTYNKTFNINFILMYRIFPLSTSMNIYAFKWGLYQWQRKTESTIRHSPQHIYLLKYIIKLQTNNMYSWFQTFTITTLYHLFMAFSISMVTKTDRAMVMGWGSLKTRQSTPLNSSPSPMHARWWVCKISISTPNFKAL
jgi:hypothetical protein